MSKLPGPDYIPVVVLKNSQPELPYILVELFNKCLKKSFFLTAGKSHWWSLYFRMLGKGVSQQNYYPVSLFSVVSKVFEKFVNNRLLDHLKKSGLFSDFKYDFRSSWSTANLLTVASDRIAGAFNRYGATQAIALDISKAFGRVWHSGFLCKLHFHVSQ